MIRIFLGALVEEVIEKKMPSTMSMSRFEGLEMIVDSERRR